MNILISDLNANNTFGVLAQNLGIIVLTGNLVVEGSRIVHGEYECCILMRLLEGELQTFLMVGWQIQVSRDTKLNFGCLFLLNNLHSVAAIS